MKRGNPTSLAGSHTGRARSRRRYGTRPSRTTRRCCLGARCGQSLLERSLERSPVERDVRMGLFQDSSRGLVERRLPNPHRGGPASSIEQAGRGATLPACLEQQVNVIVTALVARDSERKHVSSVALFAAALLPLLGSLRGGTRLGCCHGSADGTALRGAGSRPGAFGRGGPLRWSPSLAARRCRGCRLASGTRHNGPGRGRTRRLRSLGGRRGFRSVGWLP
jgi:hypothetical protein